MVYVQTIRLNDIEAAFTTGSAPWGTLHVAAGDLGIVAVDLGAETPEFVDGLARRLHGSVLPADDADVPEEWRHKLIDATRQIEEYLAGERHAFAIPLDLRTSDWDRLVLTGAARLQYGETASYGQLAARIGKPGAAQAVGGAMGRNPMPILIPCHRIIAAGGRLGGYGGASYADRIASLAIKRTLLGIEGSRSAIRRSSAAAWVARGGYLSGLGGRDRAHSSEVAASDERESWIW